MINGLCVKLRKTGHFQHRFKTVKYVLKIFRDKNDIKNLYDEYNIKCIKNP